MICTHFFSVVVSRLLIILKTFKPYESPVFLLTVLINLLINQLKPVIY